MGEETTATTISFRSMSAADIPAVEKMEAEAFYDAWSQNMLLNEINNELTTYLVMELEGKVIGYCGFWLVAGEAQITRVAVVKELRGQGFGTRLTALLSIRSGSLAPKLLLWRYVRAIWQLRERI